MAVVKEQEILSKFISQGLNGNVSASEMQAIVEKMGIDFGRTVHCRNDSPYREWTNKVEEFEPSESEQVASKKAEDEVAQKKHDDEVEAKVSSRMAAEREIARDKEMSEMRATIAALLTASGSGAVTPPAPPVTGKQK